MTGSKVSLCPVEPQDAELWYAWLNDPDVAVPLGSEAFTAITLPGMQEAAARMMSSGDPVFTIVHNETDRAIGRCMLFHVDHINRTANVGIFIGEADCRGGGLGTEALTLLLDYGFCLLNLHAVMLGVYAFNEHALACYRKVGFREIGRRRQMRLIDGKYYDGILMDILEDEFRGKQPVSRLPVHGE